MPTSIIPTKRSSTSFVGVCSGAILSGESMDPLEKFKTDFARARGEAHQPKAAKADDKPRPKRKANGPAPVKPTAAQNSLREFGDALTGDELDNNPPSPQYSEINPPPPQTKSDMAPGRHDRDRHHRPMERSGL